MFLVIWQCWLCDNSSDDQSWNIFCSLKDWNKELINIWRKSTPVTTKSWNVFKILLKTQKMKVSEILWRVQLSWTNRGSRRLNKSLEKLMTFSFRPKIRQRAQSIKSSVRIDTEIPDSLWCTCKAPEIGITPRFWSF